MSAKWKLLILSSVLALTSIFQMGYTNAYPNTAISSFREFLNESHSPPGGLSETSFEWQWSAMLNTYFIGFAIGSCITASIADRLGRKWTLVAGNTGNLLSVIVATASIFFHLPILFTISRLIMSLSAATSMNSLILLLQESAPVDMKGIVSFNAEMAFVVTNLIGAMCGMQNVLGADLLLLIGLSIIPTIVSVIISLFLHESPRYLVLKKNDEASASGSLKFYQQLDESSINATIDDIRKEGSKDEKQTTLKTLLNTTHLRKGFLLGLATMQVTTSIWPIIYYSTDFLTRAGSSYELAESVSTVMLFVSSLSTIVGMFIVERFPRKKLLLTCAIINITALLFFSTCAMLQTMFTSLTYACIASLIVHGISYSVALGPIAWFLTSELVPMSSRALAQSLVLAINHTVGLVISFLSFPLYTIFGPVILVILFVLPGYFCIIVLLIYLPETRDVHINEVVSKLRGSSIKSISSSS